jgi:hypothetical protein
MPTVSVHHLLLLPHRLRLDLTVALTASMLFPVRYTFLYTVRYALPIYTFTPSSYLTIPLSVFLSCYPII